MVKKKKKMDLFLELSNLIAEAFNQGIDIEDIQGYLQAIHDDAYIITGAE